MIFDFNIGCVLYYTIFWLLLSGGINDVVYQIQDLCIELQVPIVFAMSRRRLALVLKKRHKIGCVGIFSYDGAEVSFLLLLSTIACNFVTWIRVDAL